LLRPRDLSSTPPVSRAPRMMWYRTPGRSRTRPPRISTTECSCRLCPSPGMYAVTSIPLLSRTRATFLSAEFGFFGVTVRTWRQTPRFCGLPLPRFIRFRSELKTYRRAGVFAFFRVPRRGLRTNWLVVGIQSTCRISSRTRQTRASARVTNSDYMGAITCPSTGDEAGEALTQSYPAQRLFGPPHQGGSRSRPAGTRRNSSHRAGSQMAFRPEGGVRPSVARRLPPKSTPLPDGESRRPTHRPAAG